MDLARWHLSHPALAFVAQPHFRILLVAKLGNDAVHLLVGDVSATIIQFVLVNGLTEFPCPF